MVRRFLLQCVLLALPLFLLFGLVAWVDPYGLFGNNGPVPKELKKKNLYHSGRTMPFSNMMWKLVEFRRTPVPDIMLGDSRLSYFDLDALKKATGHTYYNFGIPGGNYSTIDRLFHYTDSLTTLRNVYVQVSFRGLNSGNDFDIYKEPSLLLDKPYSYVYNRRVLEAAGLNLMSWLFPSSVEYNKPPPDQWREVLDAERSNADHFFPDSTVFLRLQHMADRCRAAGATLVFVEYPTHPDVQEIYGAPAIAPIREAYFEQLARIAPLIDLDRPGMFPADRSFWRDPLHLTADGQRTLIGHIWRSPN